MVHVSTIENHSICRKCINIDFTFGTCLFKGRALTESQIWINAFPPFISERPHEAVWLQCCNCGSGAGSSWGSGNWDTPTALGLLLGLWETLLGGSRDELVSPWAPGQFAHTFNRNRAKSPKEPQKSVRADAKSYHELLPSAHSFTLGTRRIGRTFNFNRLYCREQMSERVPKNPQEVVLSEHWQCSGSGDLVVGRSLLADSFTRKTVHIFNHRASEQKVLLGWQILLTYSSVYW